MKEKFMKIICCPVCKQGLELIIKKRHGDEITEGKLICKNCKKEYCITEGIPNLLP